MLERPWLRGSLEAATRAFPPGTPREGIPRVKRGQTQGPFPRKNGSPATSVISDPKAGLGESSEGLRRRRRKGDPAFILPEPIVHDGGQGRFPSAEKSGASPAQLVRPAAMYKAGLHSKAQRAAYCGVLGQRRECIANQHGFYIRYGCGNRYCPTCRQHSFAALFSKHLVLEGVARRLVPHWPVHGYRPLLVIAKMDFTIRNTGEMPTPEVVKQFNWDIRKFFRLLEQRFGISRKDYGVLWCDEFGGSNTNLHAHAVYAGPWLPQKGKELSGLWSEVVGEQAFLSIRAARSFPAGLAHALKYTSKHVSASTPTRLAELERAFHGVRRVHTLACFYNVKQAEPGEDWPGLESRGCPLCGSALLRVSGCRLELVRDLETSGLRDLGDCWRVVGRERVFGGNRGLPP